jgi:hypothetical protein
MRMSFAAHVSDEVLMSEFPPLLDHFLDTSLHTELDNQVADAIEGGRRGAILVPAVGFIIKASINVCNVPSVYAQLSNEVLERSNQIADVAEHIGKLGIIENWFLIRLVNNQRLRKMVDNDMSLIEDHLDPKKQNILSSMVRSPLTDTAYAGGGAIPMLDRQGLKQRRAEIIGRSTSLLMFAQLYERNTLEPAERLLGGPYIRDEYYEFTGSDTGQEDIGFTEEGVKRLRQLIVKKRGCPAAGMYADEIPEQSVLRVGWTDIVNFLITPDSWIDTSSNRPVQPG